MKGGLKFSMAGFGVQYVMITGHKSPLRSFAECWDSIPVRKSDIVFDTLSMIKVSATLSLLHAQRTSQVNTMLIRRGRKPTFIW